MQRLIYIGRANLGETSSSARQSGIFTWANAGWAIGRIAIRWSYTDRSSSSTRIAIVDSKSAIGEAGLAVMVILEPSFQGRCWLPTCCSIYLILALRFCPLRSFCLQELENNCQCSVYFFTFSGHFSHMRTHKPRRLHGTVPQNVHFRVAFSATAFLS